MFTKEQQERMTSIGFEPSIFREHPISAVRAIEHIVGMNRGKIPDESVNAMAAQISRDGKVDIESLKETFQPCDTQAADVAYCHKLTDAAVDWIEGRWCEMMKERTIARLAEMVERTSRYEPPPAPDTTKHTPDMIKTM